MAVYFGINGLPVFKNAVLTIGTFDGVHLGHRTILQEVANHARKVNGESILITFEPHPRKLLFPDQPLGLLTPLDEKLKLITAQGIEHVVVAPFTKDFANLPAKDYIKDFLVKYFHPHTIIIGYDHRFGHDRKGDFHLMEQYKSELKYDLVEIPVRLIDEAAISSTKIRAALIDGHVDEAAHMLGRNYSLACTVIKGRQLGRTIGYPTANITPADAEQLIPGNGIYAVIVHWDGTQYMGMLSVGYNPTVTDEKTIKIEVNIFDLDADLYDREIEIEFIKYLRPEEKFASIDELKSALDNDKQMALQFLMRQKA